MASPKKTASGRWHIQIEIAGVRDSGTFPTKREATEWAAARSLELRTSKGPAAGQNRTLADAIDKYVREIVPAKRGYRWEEIRFRMFLAQEIFPSRKIIGKVTPEDIAEWRDYRARTVKPASVLREMTLVSSVFEAARREWRWVSSNPVRDVRKPPLPMHRERVIAWHEIRAMLRVMNWHGVRPARTMTAALAACFLCALQTGMRAGELCALRWEDVHNGYCRLQRSKTGAGRDVPLTHAAQRNIESMKGWDEDLVFGLVPATRDALFRKYRRKAGLDGFTFHDARHTAATRIAGTLHVLDLCKMFGWSNPKRAMTYYNPKATDIAARLNAAPTR